MSDVGLSNASPTLERVDARQPDAARAPVRRALFGAPDREEVRRYLNESIRESVREFREEYDFDPVDDRPLTPRTYQWEEDDDAPDFYRRAPHRSRESRQRDADSARGDSRAPAAAEQPQQQQQQPERDGSRKRRSGDSGDRCEGPSKRSHNEPDDEDEPGSCALRAATAAEESAAAAAEVEAAVP